MKSKGIYELMSKAEDAPFSFFSDKEKIFDNTFQIYKQNTQYYVVCEIPRHSVDIRYIEITESDAIMIQKNYEMANDIISKYVE